MEYFGISLFIAFFSLFFLFCYSLNNKNGVLTNWPLLGMLPSLLQNHHRIHDFFGEIVQNSQMTFLFEGPWFTNMNLLATVNPANVHHIFSTNFHNYPKGSKFKEIFEILGEGIFNSDADMWQYHRKMAQSFLAHPRFQKFMVNKIWEKVKTGLIPILEHASKQGSQIDLQDLFERLSLDTFSSIIMDHDPKTLCNDSPNYLPLSNGIHDIEKAMLYRHVVPTCVWKLQRWLNIGHERKYKEGWVNLDVFVYECISKKRTDLTSSTMSKEVGVDLITLYMNETMQSDKMGKKDETFLRDTFLNFLLAGRDTTSVALSWFFYLIATNPHVMSKIKEELGMIEDHSFDYLSRNFEDIRDKLVYLHATLCEAMRLYPPVAFEAKVPAESEILPSGHKVDPNMQIVLSLYAMGRMKSIWGEDSLEFKPERWITERGTLRHEPSYKFFAFNAGPRTCVGKNMAFTQMKIVAVAIITNYKIEPVEGHPVIPDVSIILHMKHGFKVNVLSPR